MARNRNIIRMEALYRKLLLSFGHKNLPILLITEYPKSGASWLGQILQDVYEIPFPRQKFPYVCSSIFHGHYINIEHTGPTIVFWRDPRDIIVSWYHHCLFKSDKNNSKLVDSHRKSLGFKDINNIEENLPEFIKFIFEKPISPKFNFNDFFDFWHGKDGVLNISYEQLSLKPKECIESITRNLSLEVKNNDFPKIISKYSFKQQSDRNRGQEDKANYLRKGIVGDWKNYFNKSSCDIVQEYLGDRLIKLGYVSQMNGERGV